jgi:hypothetical protein
MKCDAIKPNLTCCKGKRALGNVYCSFHRDSDYEDHHKGRWFKKYILAAKGGLYLVNYPPASQEKINSDLDSGRVVLIENDIASIPILNRYVDIFALLCSKGIALRYMNTRLWTLSVMYVIALISYDRIDKDYLSFIVNSLLGDDTSNIYNLLLCITTKIIILARPLTLRETFNITTFLSSFYEIELMKKFSWENRTGDIYEDFKRNIGEDHIITTYMASRFLPEIKSILKTEMQIQKAKMFHYKEEIVQKAWHPRRLEMYLNMGYALEDVTDEYVDTTLFKKCILQEKSTLYC